MDLRSFNVYGILFAKCSLLISAWMSYQEASFYDMDVRLHNSQIQDAMAMNISEVF